MSRSSHPTVRIGCPRCTATLNASVPPGAGIVDPEREESARLRGTATSCGNCGHELELYFY